MSDSTINTSIRDLSPEELAFVGGGDADLCRPPWRLPPEPVRPVPIWPPVLPVPVPVDPPVGGNPL